MGIEVFAKHIREKRAIKVDTGYNNQDLNLIAKIARAAQNAKASAIDTIATKEAIDTVRKNSKLPVFVSSIQPFDILNAVKWGVDAVEIGNWEEMYKNGTVFSCDEFYDIILETMGLISQYDVFVSVAIPANIEILQQVELIKKLEILGVNLIQIEGVKEVSLRKINYIKDVDAAIANTFELNKISKMPIITSYSISSSKAQEVFEAGSAGVALDESVSKLDTEIEMTSKIRSLVGSVAHKNSINREIVRNQIELAFN